MKMYERRIHLLSDEEISLILTGLRLLSSKCISDNDKDMMLISDNLYKKIDNSYEIGVISNEKNEYRK